MTTYWGDTPCKKEDSPVQGGFTERDGETWYRISAYDRMQPFFLTLTSGDDHWFFLSSNGGLTCGRKSPDHALFPYVTDDHVHEADSTTGPSTLIRVSTGDQTKIWQPFRRDVSVYRLERALYKNLAGNRIIFEEINHDLGLVFSYQWATSARYGFVRKAVISNLTEDQVDLQVLDGLRNLLPHGVDQMTQAIRSTLVDAYKQAEAMVDVSAAVYSLAAIIIDRAEPSEALRATVTWCLGLDRPEILLTDEQREAFLLGEAVQSEAFRCGKRSAFHVCSPLSLTPGQSRDWYLVADIDQGPSSVVNLLEDLAEGVNAEDIEADIADGTRRLRQLVESADGSQFSADRLTSGRHFANTLFNIMRGGVFQDDFHFSIEDFAEFVQSWNRPLFEHLDSFFEAQQKESLTLSEFLELANQSENPDFIRLVYEYLPLLFSRRHGDPSRPWNDYSIELYNDDGSPRLGYQGNWRDIFQNWEALTISYPEYAESFVTKFVNATTADGYNPYHISRDGIGWEVLDSRNPWSNIGYWGDHQVNYLVRLLELSHDYHPGRLGQLLTQEVFVYADVPYRLNGYEALKDDPRNSVTYDDARSALIDQRVADIGSDGRLIAQHDGSILRANLMEKLLVTALVKLSNLVPGGGIWMNTQRPEWNDANNALVGYGLSMVTLCYLRRFVALLGKLVEESSAGEYHVANEVAVFFESVTRALGHDVPVLGDLVSGAGIKRLTDELGHIGEGYRTVAYAGFSGQRSAISRESLTDFVTVTLRHLDHSISINRRPDGLYHSYNLIRFSSDEYAIDTLQEMLEGQVAVLSSGYLDAAESLELLGALRSSTIFREDQNSYMLYPNKKLPGFLEKNVFSESMLDGSDWLKNQLAHSDSQFIERDRRGQVHFNGRFRNADGLRDAMLEEGSATASEIEAASNVYEEVFQHHAFTGRSGTMYKYEGLGSIYWHMVSKLLVATTEIIEAAAMQGEDPSIISGLSDRFDEIKDGIGAHKSPNDYGAIPTDPYSHTPSFTGVQQPGMTGQVKEDIIARFRELGVIVREGELSFRPVSLYAEEFLQSAQEWRFSVGDQARKEALPPGSMAFSLCGVPVVYHLADQQRIVVTLAEDGQETIDGNSLTASLSQSLFERDGTIQRIDVDVPRDWLRSQ